MMVQVTMIFFDIFKTKLKINLVQSLVLKEITVSIVFRNSD